MYKEDWRATRRGEEGGKGDKAYDVLENVNV